MINHWRIPQAWTPHGECYIIGGGPSLKEMDLSPLKDKCVIGTNDAYLLGNWVDITLFVDSRWYEVHAKQMKSYQGVMVTNLPESKANKIDDPQIKFCKRILRQGLSIGREGLCWNFSSGGCAMDLAFHLGVRRVILLGFDMKLGDNGKANWHPNNISGPNADVYKRFMKPFETIKEQVQEQKLDFEILNATPGSAMDLFPMVELKDVL